MGTIAFVATHFTIEALPIRSAMQHTDTTPFEEIVNAATGSFFQADQPIVTARAPGRLDVMGGIADYSGSLVLEMPIAEATHCAIQLVDEPLLTIRSPGVERVGSSAEYQLPLSTLATFDYASARAHFAAIPEQRWAAYIVGIFLVLMRENGAAFGQGVRLLIHSTIPEATGVSSSAAVEVAVMRAVIAAFDLNVAEGDIAKLCQSAENHVAGAPCGIMDQMTVVHGRPNQLLALLCQPAEIKGYLPLPDQYTIWGINSGIRHAVSGSDYTSVRIGAFMGLKIIQSITGQDWDGYLTNITPSYFEQHLRLKLPNSLNGQAFLDQYGDLPDTITTVDPSHTYAIRQPTAHPIYEHFRVQTFAQLLAVEEPLSPGRGSFLSPLPGERVRVRGSLLGELMYQSHASYSACALGSTGTDRLVQLVREKGESAGLYGAKISGGGSGGTVVILGHPGASDAIQSIAQTYQSETGHSPHIFRPTKS